MLDIGSGDMIYTIIYNIADMPIGINKFMVIATTSQYVICSSKIHKEFTEVMDSLVDASYMDNIHDLYVFKRSKCFKTDVEALKQLEIEINAEKEEKNNG